jgi:hypothetical protein
MVTGIPPVGINENVRFLSCGTVLLGVWYVKLPYTQRIIPAGQNRVPKFGWFFFSDYVHRPETCACAVIVSILIHSCAEFVLLDLLTQQVEVVTVLTCIRKESGSNLDRYTDYSEALSWFSSVLAVFLAHMFK